MALFIMGVVVQLLFVGYRHGSIALRKARQEKEAVLTNERLLLRLKQIFDQATSCRERELGGFVIEYTGGTDVDPRFRLSLEGQLYVDKKELMLITRGEEGETRLEVLHDKVSAIALSFFDVHEGCFVEKFPKSRPPMVKVTVNQNTVLPIFL